MLIRRATENDKGAIWSIMGPVIRAGETYALAREMSEAESAVLLDGARRVETFVAVEDRRIIGTYYLRPNQVGGGDHVANSGYITDPVAGGQGVGQHMCKHSLSSPGCAAFTQCDSFSSITTNDVRKPLEVAGLATS